MSIKSIGEALVKSSGMNLEDMFSLENTNSIISAMEELNTGAEISQEIILKEVKEEDLVKMMLMAQKIVVASLAQEGDSTIVIADLKGRLTEYTHTVVLMIIGALIQDEVL